MMIVFAFTLRAGDWPTFGHDPQRSGWAFEEDKLSPENAKGLQLKWAVQVDNEPLALDALTAPVVASAVATAQGKKTLVYVAGSSDHFFALDADNGKVVWTRTFESSVLAKDEPFFLCPNAVNATPTIDKERNVIYTISRDGKLYGLDPGTGEVKYGPFQFVPAFSKTWSLNLVDGFVYTTTSQGCGGDRSGIYSMDVRNRVHPSTHELLVRRGNGGGLWARGGTALGANHRLYVSTGDGLFDPTTGDYGSTFLGASLGDLNLVDYYTPLNWLQINKADLDLPSGGFVSFPYKNYNLLAGGGKESVAYLLDADSLGGKDHHTPLFTTPPLGNDERVLAEKGMWGSPAVWKDETGQPWLYFSLWGPISKHAPAFPINNGPNSHGSIVAFTVTIDQRTKEPQLEPAWLSPDFDIPDPPVVANGVLFALATGENPKQNINAGIVHYKSVQDWKNNLLTTAQRSADTRPAVLYALDAKTGKMLYQSGTAMKSWVHFSGLAVSEGRIYSVDHDSRVYCFGLKGE
jgi:outer membrane protein assembly factor BamB